MEEKVFSNHHFMFPFRWDILTSGFKISDIKENISFDDRTNLDAIKDKFGNWSRKKFQLTSTVNELDTDAYNEFNYFHEFVAKTVFDFDYPWKKNQQIVKYFEYNLDKSLTNKYSIEYLENDKQNKDEYLIKNYELNIEGITLHFFNTGVGVLTYNLSNSSYRDADSILKINEYGRRMYPQFLPLDTVKKAFLANKITLQINTASVIEEDFTTFNNLNSILSAFEPYRLPRYIRELFSEEFIFKMTDVVLIGEKILITKVTDDRMFFMSWYGNDEIAKTITTSFTVTKKLKNDWLYAYIFGDKEIKNSIANSVHQEKHLEEHTYTRWIEDGTVYGISRDSFVALTPDNRFGSTIIRSHMNTMYYTIAVLCLAQRTSILKFTAEIANIADLAKLEEEKKTIANIKEVYKNYIEFINKLYFREITPQIQGIELYNQFQKLLNIDKEITDLDNEISELHEYVSLLQNDEQNRNASLLNKVAFIFLPITVVFGVLGANFFPSDNDSWDIANNIGYGLLEQVKNGLLLGFLISAFLISLMFGGFNIYKKFKIK